MVGNFPNFTKNDILRCFLRFEKNVSRQELAKELELGEGTIRTMLETLKSKSLLESTKKGHFLSKKGSETLKSILECASAPKSIAMQSLYPEFRKVALVVRGNMDLKNLYKLRDIAVKNGADGAVILKFRGRLYAPESDLKQDYAEIEKYFDFRENDIAIVAFASTSRNAENGALAIAVELCDSLKKFIESFE